MKRFLYQPKGRANETHAFIAGRRDGLYAVNHASGCSHGCRYPCYAQNMQEKLHKRSYDSWIMPIIYMDAPEAVRKELQILGNKVKDVELCFTTDPFMFGQTRMHEVTNELLDILTEFGIGATILTKGDLFDNISIEDASDCNLKYGISLVTLSDLFRMEWEPAAAPPKVRIAGLKQMAETGYDTWISIEPFPPEPFKTNNVEDVLHAVPFVKKAVLGRWNYAGITAFKYYSQVAHDFERTCLEMGIECKVKGDIR